MKFIKSFRILLLLFAMASCDLILNDYGNGNKGAGINDQVTGKDNTWLGNSNTINGDVNKVIGDQNRVDGSNNIVQGSGNVIGNLSPQEMAKLQNQMFASFQNRFKGMVDFNSMNQAPRTNTINADKSTSPSKAQDITANNNAISASTNNKAQPNQSAQTAKTPSLVRKNNIRPKQSSKSAIQDRLMLVFRSFGRQFRQLMREDIYNLEERPHKPQKSILCKRWNYCLHKDTNQRWSFSSAFPYLY